MKKIPEGYKETELGVIPQDWEVQKVSDLTVEHKQGFYTKDNYVNEGVYLVRITDMMNPKISYSEMPKVDIDDKTYEQFKLEYNDFLFARSGAIGRYGIFKEDEKAIFASYLIRFRFLETLNTRFFGYFYESNKSISQLLAITQGSSNININANNIKALNVPLPPLPEQQKIAEILSSVDDHIEKLDETISEYELLKKGMMKKLLTEGIGNTEFKDTEIGRIPKDWEVKVMSEICSKIFVGIATSTTEYFSENGVPLLRNQNIKEDKLDTKDLQYITNEFSNANKTKLLREGDILTVRTGYPGISCVVKKEFEGAQTFTTLISRPKFEAINSVYLSKYINSDIGKKILNNLKAGGAQKNLNVASLQTLKVIVPPLPEQQKIASILSSIDERIDLYKSEKEDFVQVKKGLMEKLLTGKIRV